MIDRRKFLVGMGALFMARINAEEKTLVTNSGQDNPHSLFSIAIKNNQIVSTRQAEKIVPWWSFTKTVIAAAALTLVRDGKLTLDALLPKKPYTLRQLLQHRAGLPDYGSLPEYHAAVAAGDTPWSRTVFLEKTNADKLLFQPGQGWQYSNLGYGLIADLICEVTSLDLQAALSSLVLKPLGAVHAYIVTKPAELENVVMGSAKGYHPGWVFHGLLVGPLQEAALLLHQLMGGALLPPSLLDIMRETHYLGDIPIGDRPWIEPGYALGLMRGRVIGNMIIEGHTGEGPGSVIAIYHIPDIANGLTVATFHTQSDPAFVENLIITIMTQQLAK